MCPHAVHEQSYQPTQLGILPHLEPSDQKGSQYPTGKALPLAHPLRSYFLPQLLIHHPPLLFAASWFSPPTMLPFGYFSTPFDAKDSLRFFAS
jgi:hypothetical protein